MRAAVDAALYHVTPPSEIEAIPDSWERKTPKIPQAPEPQIAIERNGKHPRAAYWREYARARYHSDPAFRRRRIEQAKKRGAK